MEHPQVPVRLAGAQIGFVGMRSVFGLQRRHPRAKLHDAREQCLGQGVFVGLVERIKRRRRSHAQLDSRSPRPRQPRLAARINRSRPTPSSSCWTHTNRDVSSCLSSAGGRCRCCCPQATQEKKALATPYKCQISLFRYAVPDFIFWTVHFVLWCYFAQFCTTATKGRFALKPGVCLTTKFPELSIRRCLGIELGGKQK